MRGSTCRKDGRDNNALCGGARQKSEEKLYTRPHCVGDPGIVREIVFALPTARHGPALLLFEKSRLKSLEDFCNNNLRRQLELKA